MPRQRLRPSNWYGPWRNLGGGDNLRIRLAYLLRSEAFVRRDFHHYTLPVVGNYFFWGGGVTIFSAIIGHLGNDAVAANSIASIVRNMITCVTKGIGTAGAILVGNELGKNAIERAKRYARRSTALSAALGVLSGTSILLLRPLILSAVALTPAAAQYLSGMLLICSYYVGGGRYQQHRHRRHFLCWRPVSIWLHLRRHRALGNCGAARRAFRLRLASARGGGIWDHLP